MVHGTKIKVSESNGGVKVGRLYCGKFKQALERVMGCTNAMALRSRDLGAADQKWIEKCHASLTSIIVTSAWSHWSYLSQ